MSDYIEDNRIILPVLTDGVNRIGDLWNCHKSEFLGENLFTQNLDGKYVNASPKQTIVKYELIHSKSTSEELKTVNVCGEMAIEVLTGLLSVKGRANYKNVEKQNSNVEKLICYYESETYFVEAERDSKELIDPNVCEMIEKRELDATHFVRSVILGAELRADIKISNSDKKSSTDISGNFFGKLTFGKINAILKANLKFLDSADNKDLNTEISVHSMPTLKTLPKSIDKMFEMIDSIGSIVENNKHFPEKGDHIIGVPIRFLLMPIKTFINNRITFDIEKLYIRLSDKVMQDFNETLIKIHDLQVPGYVAKQILSINPKLIILLNDELSNLSTQIRKYENELKTICIEYLEKSVGILKKYKIGKVSVEDLMKVRNDFESKCDSKEINESVNKYTEEGEAQIQSVHLVDIQDSDKFIEILTNKRQLQNFIVGEIDTKIWLMTEHESPEEVFPQFFKMAKPLNSKMGCKLGIAIQEISTKFELNIKVNGEKTCYDNKQEIPFIISIISATVGFGFDNELLFHSLNAEKLNTRLPFVSRTEMLNINILISNLINLNFIKIAKSHFETLKLLTKNDNELKFFVPINFTQTSFQAIRNLPNLIMTAKRNRIEIIAGNIDIAVDGETAFLFVIKNCKVIAVCLDDNDLNLLEERITDFTQLEFLSPKSLDHSFYPQRVISSENIIKEIESSDHKCLNLCSIGLKNFEEKQNTEILNALEVCSRVIKNNAIYLAGILAKFALNESKALSNYLSKAGYSSSDSKFSQNIFSDESKYILKKGIEKILLNTDPFGAKVHIAIQLLNNFDNISDEKLIEFELKVIEIIDSVKEDTECTKEMKEKIESFGGIDVKTKCEQLINTLEEYQNISENNANFHLKNLLSLLNSETETNINNIMLSYIKKINIDENIFGQIKQKFIEELNKKHYYQLIYYLSECSHGVKYYYIYKGLENYCGTSDQILSVEQLITKLSDRSIFGDNQWENLWKNNRFLLIIRTFINNSRITSKLISMGCEKSVPSYIPDDIAKSINNSRIVNKDLVLPNIIRSFDHFYEVLKEMLINDIIPEKFRTVLANSLAVNNELLKKLQDLNILKTFHWDGKIFPEAIEMYTIENIVEQIDEWKRDLENSFENEKLKQIDINQFHVNFDSINKDSNRKPRIVNYVMPEELVNVFGDKQIIVSSKKFIQLNSIIQRPLLAGDEIQRTVEKITPYIIQKIKMWGCSALTADSIALLIENSNEMKNQINANALKPKFGQKPNTDSENQSKDKSIDTSKPPLSRLDAIVGVLNNVDAIVGQDVLSIMAKFPMAIPLIIRSVYEKNQYKLLIPWLTQPTIKWESRPGKIVENHLFNSNFKAIVCLRIGDVSRGKCGKSTILNQLFSDKNIFSCCGEPGAKNNRPVTLRGTAEMVYLTQETASSALWQSVLADNYKSDNNELILMINLHGNGLDFPDHLEFLKTIASAYILFIMPNNEDIETSYSKILEKLDLDENSARFECVAIDPTMPEIFNQEIIIETSKISDDSNISKLRNILKTIIINKSIKFNIKAIKCVGKLKITEFVETTKSNTLIEFVKTHSCQKIKNNMILQKVKFSNDSVMTEYVKIWKNNQILYDTIRIMGNILLMDIDSRQKAMIQIERELGMIVSEGTLTERIYYRTAQQEYQKTIKTHSEDRVSLNQWRKRINKSLENIDNMSLGLEHFFREIGKLYEINLLINPKINPFLKLAKSYAELLIAGQAIELLDGDSSSISEAWFSAICQCVYELVPKLKIFVISILGLQSSGKSTLLNAMFASKFAVSVGRCTKGLFMRLLFLNEDMKHNLNLSFDAILLIDTEGLGAPEKQNEANSEKKDRVMATLAMGVSHLTIINVLGEYMNNLTEILQIAIISMARLEKVDISPDILMVQHLTERNSDKMLNSDKSFSDALEKAIDIADKKDLTLGIKNMKCLNKLRNTISSDKLFHQFSQFKNGATAYSPPSDEYHNDITALYSDILKTAQSSGLSSDFNFWANLVLIFWHSIKDENFMRFKDVIELQGFLDTSERIRSVKASIECAFREHSDQLKQFMAESALKLNTQEIETKQVIEEMKEIFNYIPNTCLTSPCDYCNNVLNIQSELYLTIKGKPNEIDVKTTVQKYIVKIRADNIKRLSQKINAEAFRKVESAETYSKIEAQLKIELEKGSKFDKESIEKIAIKIWQKLESEAAEKVTQENVKSQIHTEIRHVYDERPDLLNKVKYEKRPQLNKITAFDIKFYQKYSVDIPILKVFHHHKKLKSVQSYELERNLRLMADKILTNDKVDTYQDGMVQKLRKAIETVLNDLEKKNNKLLVEFKWKVIIYAIQQFIDIMEEKQEIWNKQYNPLFLLKSNEEKYMKWIKDKLLYGFGFYSDGSEAGQSLLLAVKQLAIKSVNDKIVKEFKEQNWITSSEKIRLKYLSELVDEVKVGNLERALTFFRHPQSSITQWYEKRLSTSLSKDEKQVIYNNNYDKSLDEVKKHLNRLSNVKDKQKYVKEVISRFDGLDIRFTVNESETKNDSENFSKGINDEIEKNNSTKSVDDNVFIKLTDDESLLRLIGCTQSCPLCSAICWMPYGHDQDVGESKKHHTCHQPKGLGGCSYHESKNLTSDPCHDQRHTGFWVINEISMPFKQFISECGYDQLWKFESHSMIQFNELMYWFFYKLHTKIAEVDGLNPAIYEEMCEYNMPAIGEKIDVILISVKDSIYKSN